MILYILFPLSLDSLVSLFFLHQPLLTTGPFTMICHFVLVCTKVNQDHLCGWECRTVLWSFMGLLMGTLLKMNSYFCLRSHQYQITHSAGWGKTLWAPPWSITIDRSCLSQAHTGYCSCYKIRFLMVVLFLKDSIFAAIFPVFQKLLHSFCFLLYDIPWHFVWHSLEEMVECPP